MNKTNIRETTRLILDAYDWIYRHYNYKRKIRNCKLAKTFVIALNINIL
jgi:hypothetical protein